jgi:hypothetical protein
VLPLIFGQIVVKKILFLLKNVFYVSLRVFLTHLLLPEGLDLLWLRGK